jgi:hypothetical protein
MAQTFKRLAHPADAPHLAIVLKQHLGGIQANYTVATLPDAVANQGVRSFASDADATIFYSVVAGGGTNYVPVFSDGTDWRIG